MATGPIHPAVQTRADQRLMQPLKGISSEAIVWTVERFRETNARILQEKVEGVFSDSLERLHEELSVEDEAFIKRGLQRLEFYPSIHRELLALIRDIAPNSALATGDLSTE